MGGFFGGEAAKKAKFNNAALLFINAGETREGIVKSDDIGAFRSGWDEGFFEDDGAAGTAFRSAMVAGIVNKNLVHEASSDGDKVSAVLGVDGPMVNETEIGFMDEHSAAESVIGVFSPEKAVSEVVELVVDQGNESLKGFRIPLSPADKEFRNGLGCHAGDLGNED